MADQPKTGETNVKSKPDVKSKPINKSDTELTIDAVKKCFSDQDLILSETYPFIILFILFYITTTRAYFLTSRAKSIPCQENIRRGEYDDFISGFVYWIISFCILIFIKFNGINFVNKFVITTDTLNTKSEVGDRAKYVGQTLLTGFTSVLNIYFVFILLLTLYHIIDKTVNLIECKSEMCTKYNLCKDGDPSKARYYKSDGTCYDSNFDILKTINGSNKDKPTISPSERDSTENPNIGRLKSDFYPRWFMDIIDENTQGWGLRINAIVIIIISIGYIFLGWNNPDHPKYSTAFKVILLILALLYIGWWSTKFISGLSNTGEVCDNEICTSDDDCKDKDHCVMIGFTTCDGGRCDDGKGSRVRK
tara:strand:+ start:412 stop:1503 length:1092 start_codon:yes stop_codon:yes gene_type:complete